MYSPLITETMPPWRQSYGNKWSARPAGVRINGLIVHHHGTTSEAGITRLVSSSDRASANYIVRNSGGLVGSVPEEHRAWTSGSYAADDDKITVEVQDETGAPEWRISDAAMATLVALYADLAARYGFPPDRAHISGHRDWAATACPGPWLYARLGWVAQQASVVPVSHPITSSPPSAPSVPPVPSAPAPIVQEDDMLSPEAQQWIHDELVKVVRAEVGVRVRDALIGDLRAIPGGTVSALMAAEVPEHSELTGIAREVRYVLRDTRIRANEAARNTRLKPEGSSELPGE